MLAEAIEELKKRVGSVEENLSNNEVFVTAALHANQIAQRTHQEEKLLALRNAIQNSAFSNIDENIQLMFLRFIDELSPLHLKILNYFEDPLGWQQRNNVPTNSWSSSLKGELKRAIAELNNQ